MDRLLFCIARLFLFCFCLFSGSDLFVCLIVLAFQLPTVSLKSVSFSLQPTRISWAENESKFWQILWHLSPQEILDIWYRIQHFYLTSSPDIFLNSFYENPNFFPLNILILRHFNPKFCRILYPLPSVIGVSSRLLLYTLHNYVFSSYLLLVRWLMLLS